MRELVRQEIKRYHEEKELFAQNEADIVQLNYQLLKWLLGGFVAMCAISSMVMAASGEFNNMVLSYGVTTFIFIVILVLYRFIPERAVLPCFYLFFIALLVYSAYSAAILYPTYTGVISLGVFVLMPIIILDKRMRGTLMELVLLLLYLVFVIPHKEWVIHQDEIIYNLSFAAIGMILGFYMRRVRLENIELIRQGKIRETTDVLTGLYNRRKLFDYFGAFEDGKVGEMITGISILDIDFFKKYNDTYGHVAGDQCLKKVGDCMKTYGEQNHMEFYRYGGEEFVAIAHEQDQAQLAKAFTGIPVAIEALHIPREDEFVTISQGVLFVRIDGIEAPKAQSAKKNESKEGNHLKGLRFQQYLSQADAALYRAKENGRNRTEVVPYTDIE